MRVVKEISNDVEQFVEQFCGPAETIARSLGLVISKGYRDREQYSYRESVSSKGEVRMTNRRGQVPKG